MKRLILILRNNRGTSGGSVILACCIIGVVMVLMMELYRYYTIKENMDRQMSRAINMAIDVAMEDSARQVHISKIDTAVAYQEFYKYLTEDLGLDEQLKYSRDNLNYQLYLNSVSIEAEPPRFEVEGTVILEPELLKGLVPYTIEIPVRARARNQRMD